MYSTLKTFAPDLAVFPAFSHESILGVQSGQPCEGLAGSGAAPPPAVAACVAAGLAVIAPFKRDVLALSVLPLNAFLGKGGAWQLWYATAVLDKLAPADAASVVIVEYGYPSADITVNFANETAGLRGAAAAAAVVPAPAGRAPASRAVADAVADATGAAPTPICIPLFNSTVAASADFFSYLVDLSTRYSVGYTALLSARDVLPTDAATSCPCASSAAHKPFCTYISTYRSYCQGSGQLTYFCEAAAKAGGTLGARDADGAPKGALYAALQAARAGAAPGAAWHAAVARRGAA